MNNNKNNIMEHPEINSLKQDELKDDVDIKNELEQHITDEFRKKVVEWVSKDDEIKDINRELKELKEEKKLLENDILNYMQNIDVNMFEIGDGKLRRSVSKTRGALKHDVIQNSLVKIFKDVQKAHTTTKFILDNRPLTERVRLKRTYKRNK